MGGRNLPGLTGKVKLPRTGAFYAIILFVAFFSLTAKNYFSISNFTNIMQQSAVLSVITICSFLAILTHQTDLSVGGVAGMAGIVAALLMRSGVSLPLVFIIALGSGMAIGVLNGVLAGFTNMPTFIITLATMSIANGIGLLLFDGSIRIDSEIFKFMSQGSIWIIPMPIIIVTVLYITFSYILKKRPYGTYLYAVGGNVEAALTSGLNTKKIKFSVYLINGGIAAFAGMLAAARIGVANPSQNLGIELDGICSAVLGGTALTGGRGSIYSAWLGAIAISLLRNGMNMIGLRIVTQMMVVGFVLIIILSIDVISKRKEDAKG